MRIRRSTLIALIVSIIIPLLSNTVAAHGSNGILGNGTNGIYIDIYSPPYSTFASKPEWGIYAYTQSGCAWFASARVFQLTGKDNPIYSGYSWYTQRYLAYGFTRGQTISAKALACYENHVSVIESINGSYVTISEGGYFDAPNNDYCVIRTVQQSEITAYNSRRGNFLGYVYLSEAPAVNLGDDFYAYIVLQKDWKCLASVNNNVQIADSNAAIPNQIWHFIKQPDGTYKIINEYNGYCLNVDEAGKTNGTNINVWKDNGEAAERWRIYYTSDYYYLKPGHCDLVVDCDNAYSTPGTNIQLYTYNGSAAQRFSIYYLSNDGIAYQKPSRPAASSVITASAPAGEQSVISWTASPEVNQFDRRSYDLHIYNESGALIHTDTGLTETDYTYAFPNKGRYLVEVVSVNTLYADWYTISEKAVITVEDPCAHNYSYSLVSEPSLSTEGQLLGVCSLCDKSFTIILPRLNSTDYTYKETRMPTCQETGIGSYTWNNSDYGEYSFEIELSKLPHTYVSQAVARTCTDYAHILYTCSVCGDTYKEYLEGEYSEWSTDYPTGIDESLIESKKEYRYSDYETKQSNEPSLSGWTQIDSEWQLSRTGDLSYVQQWPATFYTGHALYSTYNITPYYPLETATEKIVVNSSAITGYLYWHYCRNSYANGPIDRLISDEYTDTYYAFHAFYSTTPPRDLSGLSSGCYIYSNAACCTDTYWYFPVAVTTQNYSMYQKIFTYGRWGEWSEWSTTAYQENSTRKVEERTLYRYIVPLDGEHLWDNGVITLAPTETETGVKTFTCTRCGETRTEIIPKTDHIHNYVDIITEPTCTEQGYTTHTCSGCGDSYVDSYVDALGHDYELTGWQWTGYTAAKATFTCKNDSSHVQTVNAMITNNRTEPTCEAAGKVVYTAKVTFEGKDYTDTKTQTLDALDHNWNTPTYTWAADNSTVTATRTCKNDANHIETETVNTTSEVTTPATCAAKGKTTYTATFTNSAFAKQTKTVTNVPALGHTPAAAVKENETAATCTAAGGYDMVVYCSVCGAELSREHTTLDAIGHTYELTGWTWTGYTKATATFTCKNDSSHVQTVNATITSVRTEPSAETAGSVVYTAKVTIEGKDYTDTKTEILPALGHDYELSGWNWAGYTAATATFTDKYGGAPVTMDATITSVRTEPTCVEEGKIVYTATITFEGKDYTDSKTETLPATGHTPGEPVKENETVPTCTEKGCYDMVTYCKICGAEISREHTELPALGHDWNGPEYVWAEDYSTVTATRNCKNDASHVETEKVNTISEVTKPATYDEEGEIVYTATFENEAFATQTKAVATPKLEKPDDPTPGLPCDGGDNCPGNVFTDMPAKGNWAHDAIDWAIVNKVTAGTSATTFGPNAGCTRAQVVTFLWRAAGSPEPTSNNNPFTDVTGGYYYKAVLWAVENNITSGTSATTFSPNSTCTRAQIVTFLWRFEGSPAPKTTNNPFTDVKPGSYYEKAVLWASESGVTAGTSATTFSPDATCTRAQVVTFLYRDII